jgi:hypothetical protein
MLEEGVSAGQRLTQLSARYIGEFEYRMEQEREQIEG